MNKFYYGTHIVDTLAINKSHNASVIHAIENATLLLSSMVISLSAYVEYI